LARIYAGFIELNIILLWDQLYIFATISYVIDVYRGEFQPSATSSSTAVLCVFSAFGGGPILRAGTLIPQLRQRQPSLSWEDVRSGVSRILQGLFLKVVLADTIAEFVISDLLKMLLR
jgi:D-alanyl-lipoteichoic acid acyltransferase DltB (MBOAT superfamily)